MKKIIFLSFYLNLYLLAGAIYSLPDDFNLAFFELKKKVINAEEYILIISNNLEFDKLLSPLKNILNIDIPLIIITNKKTDLIKKLELYKTCYIFHFDKINTNGILIDNKRLFILTDSFTKYNFKQNYTLLLELTDKKEIEKFENFFSIILYRIQNYNKRKL